MKTAAATTEVVDGFEVLRTDSVADTFRMYASITKRLVVSSPSSSQQVQLSCQPVSVNVIEPRVQTDSLDFERIMVYLYGAG